jgi:hypothetical protein
MNSQAAAGRLSSGRIDAVPFDLDGAATSTAAPAVAGRRRILHASLGACAQRTVAGLQEMPA